MILKLFIGWILLLSAYCFVRMGWDKRSAHKGKWRTSEMHFFVASAIGGSLGTILGMQVWRHKTQKIEFKGPVYGILIVQALLGLLYFMEL